MARQPDSTVVARAGQGRESSGLLRKVSVSPRLQRLRLAYSCWPQETLNAITGGDRSKVVLNIGLLVQGALLGLGVAGPWIVAYRGADFGSRILSALGTWQDVEWTS